jgi:hypothetical protein
LGQALIGALLISALSTQLNHDIAYSRVLPPAVKPQVAAEVASAATSLGTDQPQQPSPPFVRREIIQIKNDAIVKGLRTGMEATIAASILALLVSTCLPMRSRVPEDVDAPATH